MGAELTELYTELRGVLEAYEEWEGKLIVDDAAWDGGRAELPTLTDDLWDELLAIQKRRNDALAYAMRFETSLSGGAPADPMAFPCDKTDRERWLESGEAWAFFRRERARRDVP